MRKTVRNLTALFVYTLPTLAFAQSAGGLGTFATLARSAMTWAQGLALTGALFGFLRVGYMYTQGDDRAPQSLKNTAIGTAIIAGAALIVQFIKGGLGLS